MSDRPQGRAAEAAVAALAVGLAAMLAVGLRVLARDEPITERTAMLVLVAGLGGFIAAAPAATLLLWFGRGRGRWPRALVGGVLAGGVFIPATLAVFAVKLRILDGRIEGDLASEIASGDILFSLFGAMGMFTPTGLRYLAPWPLLAVALAAAAVFSRWPRPSR